MTTSRWNRKTSLLALSISVDHMLRAAASAGAPAAESVSYSSDVREGIRGEENARLWEAMAGVSMSDGAQVSAGRGFRKTHARSASRAA